MPLHMSLNPRLQFITPLLCSPRDRLEGYAKNGVLSGLHVAFSRDGPSKVYVQVRLQKTTTACAYVHMR